MITSRLDFLTRNKWEKSLKTTEPPTKAQLMTHLTRRCNLLLEALEINNSLSKTVPTVRENEQKVATKNSTKRLARNEGSNCPEIPDTHTFRQTTCRSR
jgi:hypothetical protein